MQRRKEEGSPSDLDELYAKATLGNMQQTQPEESKILGVRWNPQTDRLIFDTAEIARLAGCLEPTKRNIVSTIGRFYNPLGFLSPVIIRFKVLFQKLCKHKVEWDETLPEEMLQEWKTLVSDLKEDVRSPPLQVTSPTWKRTQPLAASADSVTPLQEPTPLSSTSR
jgi:hypothetical protein